ncbi:MAG: YqjF family protein [Actinomycetota bacterium]
MSTRTLARRRFDGTAEQRERSPIPTPAGHWIQGQRWEDLLFCNWQVAAETVRPLVPEGLEIDTLDGSAWVSVVPMWMEDAHFYRLPPLPFISTFPEVNLRTYVKADGLPGVWFLSLDTESRINVAIARLGFQLPYFFARVAMQRGAGAFRFHSVRPGGEAELDVDYTPEGQPFEPEDGSLEYFLTERYSMYCTSRRGRLYRGDIQHSPWELRRARMELRRADLLGAMGVRVGNGAPTVFYSAATDVVLWKPIQL